MRFGGVLFDDDQTLVDTAEAIHERVCFVCRKARVRAPSMRKFTTDFFMPFGDYLYSLGISRDIGLRQIWDWVDDDFCYELTRAFPGMPELIKWLKKRHWPQGVVSAAPEAETKKRLAYVKYRLGDFNFIGGGQEKKDQLILRFCRRFSLPPKKVIFVGDYTNDMICARRAGVRAFGIVGPFATAAKLQTAGAHEIFRSHSQLIKRLKTLFAVK